ncbi:MAG: hypothetical protein BWX58_00930 [Deltaproteobacteria bacterium ADurb.Bin026]|nr:MAG: hypothetical protein BWX58_00930 [Deltaproteobacteria bacterium ADurb.Bin026]
MPYVITTIIMLDAKYVRIQPTPTTIPPTIMTIRGPILSIKRPEKNVKSANIARKAINGRFPWVAVALNIVSSGFLNTLYA